MLLVGAVGLCKNSSWLGAHVGCLAYSSTLARW